MRDHLQTPAGTQNLGRLRRPGFEPRLCRRPRLMTGLKRTFRTIAYPEIDKKHPIPGNPDKASQEATHPRKSVQKLTTSNPSPESRTKAHKERPIPRNPGQKLTREDPSPEIQTKRHKQRTIPGNPNQNLTKTLACCCRLCWLRQAVHWSSAEIMNLLN